MKKISFIVPAFNEEKNISNCINSILSQKRLKGFEYKVIVINDGSGDKTVNIVTDLSKKNKRIQLIDLKENKGRGFARHAGVKKANGDYIVFIDADITLPKDWLARVLPYLARFDAVGGIAIPDGDSTYICQKFKLKPKPLPHTTGITGSNVIYKRKIFKKLRLNPRLRGAEDTDLNWRVMKAGYKIQLVNNLIVKHREDMTFKKSLNRMFSFGKGATNLLNVYKKIRIPDVSFFLFIFLLINAIYFSLNRNFYFILLFFIYPLFVGYLHLIKKFKLGKVSSFIYGGLINYFMISSYFLGRLIGYFSKE